MKTKIYLMTLVSLILLSLLTGCMSEEEKKALKATQTWLKKLERKENHTLKELKSLKELDLGSTQVTDAGVKELQKALPGCRINH